MAPRNPNNQSCGTCKYWLQPDATNPNGICRRYPPSPQIIPTERGPTTLSAWSSTVKDAWCGEHAERSYIEPARSLNGLKVGP